MSLLLPRKHYVNYQCSTFYHLSCFSFLPFFPHRICIYLGIFLFLYYNNTGWKMPKPTLYDEFRSFSIQSYLLLAFLQPNTTSLQVLSLWKGPLRQRGSIFLHCLYSLYATITYTLRAKNEAIKTTTQVLPPDSKQSGRTSRTTNRNEVHKHITIEELCCKTQQTPRVLFYVQKSLEIWKKKKL